MSEMSDECAAVRLRVATIMGRTRLEPCVACAGSGLRWSSGAAWRCKACPQDMSRPSDAVGTGQIVTVVQYSVDDMLGWLRASGHTVMDIYEDDGGMFSFLLGDELGGVRSTSFVGLLEAAIIAVGDGSPDAGLMPDADLMPAAAPAAPAAPVSDDAALWAHADMLADVLLGVKVDHLDEPRVAAAIAAHAVLFKARQG